MVAQNLSVFCRLENKLENGRVPNWQRAGFKVLDDIQAVIEIVKIMEFHFRFMGLLRLRLQFFYGGNRRIGVLRTIKTRVRNIKLGQECPNWPEWQQGDQAIAMQTKAAK